MKQRELVFFSFFSTDENCWISVVSNNLEFTNLSGFGNSPSDSLRGLMEILDLYFTAPSANLSIYVSDSRKQQEEDV